MVYIIIYRTLGAAVLSFLEGEVTLLHNILPPRLLVSGEGQCTGVIVSSDAIQYHVSVYPYHPRSAANAVYGGIEMLPPKQH